MNLINTLLILFSFSLSAQVSRNFKNSLRPKYEIGFGAIRLDVPNYPGAANNTPRFIPFPWLIYRSDNFQMDEEGTRAKLINKEKFEFGFSGGLNFSIKSEDNAARVGMPDTDTLFGMGPGIIYRFLNNDPLQRLNFGLGVRVNISTDFFDNTSYEGLLIEPYLRYWRKYSAASSLTFFSGISASFSDQDYADFFYSIDKQFETASRKSYNAKPGLVELSASFGFTSSLSEKLSVFVAASYSDLSLAANRDSFLVEKVTNFSAIMGFSWLFFESSEMVR